MSVHAHHRDQRPDSEVYRITTAETGLSEDQRGRTRNYLVSMAIRTLCFIGAVIAPPPWRWILFAGAAFLPYVAVVMANAGKERQNSAPLGLVLRPRNPALGGAAPTEAPGDDGSSRGPDAAQHG